MSLHGLEPLLHKPSGIRLCPTVNKTYIDNIKAKVSQPKVYTLYKSEYDNLKNILNTSRVILRAHIRMIFYIPPHFAGTSLGNGKKNCNSKC